MATGTLPFKGATSGVIFNEILSKIQMNPLQLNTELPASLEQVINKSLEKDREVRYQSAREILADLRRIKRDTDSGRSIPQASIPPPLPAAGVSFWKKINWAKVASVAGPIIGMAFAWYFLADGNRRSGELERSIAVLPFEYVGGDVENEYFSDGLTEDIITKLSGMGPLKVISRSSSFRYKNTEKTPQEIGHELEVTTILQGSVRRSGENVRITAQLVDTESDRNLWAETYDRQLTDIFSIQDEIAQNIAAALQVTFRPENRRTSRRGPPGSFEAYDFYLRGRSLAYDSRRASLEQAIRAFRRAIEMDPEYALAYAGLADVYANASTFFDPTPENAREAERYSQKALELDPDLAEAHVARGLAASLLSDFDVAVEHYEKAIELNPRLFDAYYFYGRYRLATGNLEEAAELFEKASESHPQDYQSQAMLTMVYHGLGRAEESYLAAERTLELAESHLQRRPNDVRAVYMGAGALAELGRKDEAAQWAERALAIEPDEPSVFYNVACTYSRLGEVTAAIDTLEKALQAGFVNRAWIENDSDLDPLRDNPRFQALIGQLEQDPTDQEE
jgi:TolB-like protein/Tfp pilus assembly protein PilF